MPWVTWWLRTCSICGRAWARAPCAGRKRGGAARCRPSLELVFLRSGNGRQFIPPISPRCCDLASAQAVCRARDHDLRLCQMVSSCMASTSQGPFASGFPHQQSMPFFHWARLVKVRVLSMAVAWLQYSSAWAKFDNDEANLRLTSRSAMACPPDRTRFSILSKAKCEKHVYVDNIHVCALYMSLTYK